MRIFSFHSHKGGSGRTLVMVNVGEALCIQGNNVLIIDLDFEASGVPIFSSTRIPSSLFAPDNLFRLDYSVDNKKYRYRAYLTPEDEVKQGFKKSLPGLISCFTGKGNLNNSGNDVDDFLRQSLPIYESRSHFQHPMEGRMFMIPLGGFFKYGDLENDLKKLTNWTYFPATITEFEQGHKNLLQKIVQVVDDETILYGDSRSSSFIENLIFNAKEIISDICDVTIDYILIDQRAGQTGVGQTITRDTDGMVLVGVPTKGNLSGLRYFAAPEQGPEKNEEEIKEKNSGSTEGKAKLPPVLGVLLSNIPESIGLDRGLRDYSEVIRTNIVQTGWDDLIKNTNPKQFPLEELCKYFTQSHANYLIEKPNSHIKGIGKKKDAVTIREFWQFIGDKGDERTFDYHDAILLAKHHPDLRVYDQTLENRKLVWSFAEDIISFESAIVVLACHLRAVRTNGEKDAAVEARDRWSSNDVVPDRDTTQSNPFPHFYRAMSMFKAGRFQDALIDLEHYEKRLDGRIKGLPKPYQCDWPGDWRSSYLRAQILVVEGGSKINEIRLAFTKALERISWFDNKVKENEWPFKRGFTADLKLDILLDNAKFLIKQNDYSEVVNALEQAYLLDISTQVIDVIRLHYECALGMISNGEHLKGVRELKNLWANHIAEKRRSPYLRDELSHHYVQAMMEWYWRSGSCDQDCLLAVLKTCSEWENAIKNEKIQIAPKNRAEMLFYYGGAIIENLLCGNETELGKREGVVKALKYFESAVVWREDWPLAHLALAIARSIQWRSFEYADDEAKHLDLIEDEHPDATNTDFAISQARKLEQDTRQRDAFYAFEQTFAFYQDAKNINYFFDSEPAGILADYIVLALINLNKRFCEVDAYQRAFEKWLYGLGRPNDVEKATLVENIITDVLKDSKGE